MSFPFSHTMMFWDHAWGYPSPFPTPFSPPRLRGHRKIFLGHVRKIFSPSHLLRVNFRSFSVLVPLQKGRSPHPGYSLYNSRGAYGAFLALAECSRGLHYFFRGSLQHVSRIHAQRFRLMILKVSRASHIRLQVMQPFQGKSRLASYIRSGFWREGWMLAGGSRILDWVSAACLETLYRRNVEIGWTCL